MSEEVFNHHKEYMTTEEPCGYWIDGSVIYRKTLDMGVINTSQGDGKTARHNISNFGKLIKAEGVISNETGSTDSSVSLNSQLGIIYVNATWCTAMVSSSQYNGFNIYVTLYYTKSEASE